MEMDERSNSNIVSIILSFSLRGGCFYLLYKITMSRRLTWPLLVKVVLSNRK